MSFQNIQYKSNSGTINLDEAQGIVECFVSGIGNKDSVGDVCASGAFTKSLQRRKPRVVWGHNWNDPIGKVLEIYEVPASDPRLPMKMKMAGIGGLYAKVQFNLQSEKGKEAFANVAFFGEEQEWSIGYKTLRAQYDQNMQANVLYEVELYEVSPVLHGANQLTGTISVKSDEASSMPGMNDEFAQKLASELENRTGSRVKIVSIDDSSVTFDRSLSDGTSSQYKCGFHYDGNQFMFARPQRVNTPVQQPSMPTGGPGMPAASPAPQSSWPSHPNQMPVQAPVVKPPVVKPPAPATPVAITPGVNGPQVIALPRVQYEEVNPQSPARHQNELNALDAEERALADALAKIAGKYGKFNEDSTGIYAAYKSPAENEIASIGVKCANCVFFQGPGSCQIIEDKIEPEGMCRFAVIPNGIVKGDATTKKSYQQAVSEHEIEWVEDIEAKYPAEFVSGKLRNAVKKKQDKIKKYRTIDEFDVSEFEAKSADFFFEDEQEFLIPVNPEHAFYAKSMLDPILDFHMVDSYVTIDGIVVTAGLTKDFVEAINVAQKGILGRIGGSIRENINDVQRAGNSQQRIGNRIQNIAGEAEDSRRPFDLDLPTGGVRGSARPTGTMVDIDRDGWVDEGTTRPRYIGVPNAPTEGKKKRTANSVEKLASGVADAPGGKARDEKIFERLSNGDDIYKIAKDLDVDPEEIRAAFKREQDLADSLKREAYTNSPAGKLNESIYEERMAGASLAEVATNRGLTREEVRRAEQSHMKHVREGGGLPSKANTSKAPDSSDKAIYERRMGGDSLAEVAADLGLSREEVRRREQRHMAELKKKKIKKKKKGGAGEESSKETGPNLQELRDRFGSEKLSSGVKKPQQTSGQKAGAFNNPIDGIKEGSKLSSGKMDEVYASVQAQLIKQLETADSKGWSAPWHKEGMLPHNPTNSHRPYTGSNMMMLMFAQEEKGYKDAMWAGYGQWEKLGGQVRKGEKATSIFIPTIVPEKKNKAGETVEGKKVFFRVGKVFNIDQVDGIDADSLKKFEKLSETERVSQLEEVLKEMGARVEHGGGRAYYSPLRDHIQLPPFESFKDARGYYSVYAHELMHWTGGEKRLNRPNMNEFGSPAYAREELVAEIASAFFMAAHGLTPESRPDHADYVANWLQALKSDPDALKKAFSEAQQAADYAVNLSPTMRKMVGKKVAEDGVSAVRTGEEVAYNTSEAISVAESAVSRAGQMVDEASAGTTRISSGVRKTGTGMKREKIALSKVPSYDYPGQSYKPTEEQSAIIDASMTGEDMVVRALAGTGKTSTLKLIADRMQDQQPENRILYLAFNKSTQLEADSKMPKNVEARTADALAWTSMPRELTDKMGDKTFAKTLLYRNEDIAKAFGIKQMEITPAGAEEPVNLAPRDVVDMLKKAINQYSISADEKIMPRHFAAIPGSDRVPEEQVTPQLLAKANEMWADLNKLKNESPKLQINNAHVTKMWALTNPDLTDGNGFNAHKSGVNVVFFDEAQDINPVIAAVVKAQNIQKIYVGDSNQAIYGFRGAVDELDKVKAKYDLPLTKSWRFGPEVANYGNKFLEVSGSKFRVIGGGDSGSILEPGTMENANAVITRTNSGALAEIIRELEAGRTVGTSAKFKKDMTKFVNHTKWLIGGAKPEYKPKDLHDDLKPYSSWKEVVEAAMEGKDARVKMLVRIADKHDVFQLPKIIDQLIVGGDKEGPTFSVADVANGKTGELIDGLEFSVSKDGRIILNGRASFANKDNIKSSGFRFDPNTKKWYKDAPTDAARLDEIERLQGNLGAGGKKADVTVITAHRAKGLEWDRVRIADDFWGPRKNKKTGEIEMPSPEEMRLGYVAVTRAKKELDPGSLSWVEGYATGDAPVDDAESAAGKLSSGVRKSKKSNAIRMRASDEERQMFADGVRNRAKTIPAKKKPGPTVDEFRMGSGISNRLERRRNAGSKFSSGVYDSTPKVRDVVKQKLAGGDPINVGSLKDNSNREPDGPWMLPAKRFKEMLVDTEQNQLPDSEIAKMLNISEADVKKMDSPNAGISESTVRSVLEELNKANGEEEYPDGILQDRKFVLGNTEFELYKTFGYDAAPYWYNGDDLKAGKARPISREEYGSMRPTERAAKLTAQFEPIDFVRKEEVAIGDAPAPKTRARAKEITNVDEKPHDVVRLMQHLGVSDEDRMVLGTNEGAGAPMERMRKALTLKVNGEDSTPTVDQIKNWRRTGVPTAVIEEMIKQGKIKNAEEAFGPAGAAFDRTVPQSTLWPAVKDLLERNRHAFSGSELDSILGKTKTSQRIDGYRRGEGETFSWLKGKALRYDEEQVQSILNAINKKFGTEYKTEDLLPEGASTPIAGGKKVERMVNPKLAGEGGKLSSGARSTEMSQFSNDMEEAVKRSGRQRVVSETVQAATSGGKSKLSSGGQKPWDKVRPGPAVTPRQKTELTGWARNQKWSAFAQNLIAQIDAGKELSPAQWSRLLQLHDASVKRR